MVREHENACQKLKHQLELGLKRDKVIELTARWSADMLSSCLHHGAHHVTDLAPILTGWVLRLGPEILNAACDQGRLLVQRQRPLCAVMGCRWTQCTGGQPMSGTSCWPGLRATQRRRTTCWRSAQRCRSSAGLQTRRPPSSASASCRWGPLSDFPSAHLMSCGRAAPVDLKTAPYAHRACDVRSNVADQAMM